MSTQSRRKDPSVIGRLVESPEAYSFFQAIRMLERAARMQQQEASLGRRLGAGSAIGEFAPPAHEAVRLGTLQSFRYPAAELHSLVREDERWKLRVNFMGLTGAAGVMPFHYTEMILQRLKLKDDALADFLDLFNHRILSLFYRAATKYRLPLEYERKRLPFAGKSKDMHSQALLSLIGMGTPGLQNRLQISDESLVCYSGLLSQQLRSASGLKQILRDYFEVPVQIQEFVGQWKELIADARSRLGSRSAPQGQNAQLGRSVIFGNRAWFAQGKVRIVVGPLNREQFNLFAPGTESLKALNEMVRLYVGLETDYDFVIEVKRKDVPSKISLSKRAKPLVGWNTWLSSTGRSDRNGQETLRITVSANRLK